MKRKLILDVGPDQTDVLALFLALHDPEFEVLGITVSGVKSHPGCPLRVIQGVLEAVDPDRIPRLGVGFEPKLRAKLTMCHGTFMVDRCDEPCLPTDYLSLHPAEKIISQLLRENPHEITLVTLGPLSNVASVFSRERDLSHLLHRLVMVGGTVVAPGNVTAVAEANFYRDPTAAKTVFGLPVAKTLVPLDVTDHFQLGFDVMSRLPEPGTKRGDYLRDTLLALFRMHRKYLKTEGVRVPGMLALMSLRCPEMFISRMMLGDVETDAGLTTGMTVFDRRDGVGAIPNLDVITEVFAPNVRERLYAALQK